jgi:hypothetical protein
MGTKEIPNLKGELRINWDTEAAVAYNSGAGQTVERDVEMADDTHHRGERDDDE